MKLISININKYQYYSSGFTFEHDCLHLEVGKGSLEGIKGFTMI